MSRSVSFSIASDYADYAELVIGTNLFVLPNAGNYIFGGGLNYGDGVGGIYSPRYSSNGTVTIYICNGILFWTGFGYSFDVTIFA